MFYEVGYNANSLSLTAIPEPSQVISMGLFLALGLWFGRRRLNLVKVERAEKVES